MQSARNEVATTAVRAAWYLRGWRASYAERVLGRTGHDDWAGVLPHVT